MQNWQKTLLPLNASIRSAIECLDETCAQIVLIADEKTHLLGTVSDGDIRRGLIKGLDLGDTIERIVNFQPLVVPEALSFNAVLQMMALNRVHQVPIVDDNGKLLGLHLWDNLSTSKTRDNIFLIMAGGRGARLQPYTDSMPKAMLQINGKPMLQILLERARDSGFSHFVISINHLGHLIEDFFGAGDRFGVSISYIKEKRPLGTAGALSLLSPKPKIPFIVTNCDVISEIRYQDLLDFHCGEGAIATMAVRMCEWQNPFGVVEMEGNAITGFREKPLQRFHVNAGVYALSPAALGALEIDMPCDMPDLFSALRVDKEYIAGYPIYESWVDVGRPKDFELINRGC